MVAALKNKLSRATVFSFTDPVTRDEKEFPVDATISLQTNLGANISKYPVEGGGTITDHFQANPTVLQITGFISESPSQQLLTIASSLLTGAALSTGQFQGLSATFASAFTSAFASAVAGDDETPDLKKANFTQLLTVRNENDPEFPKRAMLGLTRAFEKGTLFKIRTYFSDLLYKDMVINSLSFEQNEQTGDSLRFNMTLQKIVTVKAFKQKKGESQIADPANASATEAADQGGKTGKEEEEGSLAFEQGKSVLQDLGVID